MTDDTEGTQGLLVHSEHFRGFWELNGCSSQEQEYWAIWASPQCRAYSLSPGGHRHGPAKWVGQSCWICGSAGNWPILTGQGCIGLISPADLDICLKVTWGWADLCWSEQCCWPWLDVLTCLGVIRGRVHLARLAQCISESAGNKLMQTGPYHALGSTLTVPHLPPRMAEKPVTSCLGNSRGRRTRCILRSFLWLWDSNNCFDALFFP